MFVAKFPLDERKFNMMATAYIFVTASGRRHIRDVKFNETELFDDDNDGVRPANTSVSQFVMSNSTNLTSDNVLEVEASFSASYIVVSF